MARGFGATYGSSGTDNIAATYSGAVGQRSVHIRGFRHGNGTSNLGRYLFQAGGVNGWSLNCNVGGTQFTCQFSSAAGAWTCATSLTLDAWATLGHKFDSGADTNDPTIYIDGTKNTVGSGITETATPSGTVQDFTGSVLYIGNRSATDRAFDGMLAEAAVWEALLDDNEFAALADGYSPLLIRPASLVEYVPMVRDNVSLKRAAPTITGTAVQPHPRVIYPKRKVA